MNRYVTLDSNNTVICIRWGQSIVDGEIQSGIGDIGQVQQADGTFITPVPPVPTLAESQATQINNMTNVYNQAIYNTFTSKAFDDSTDQTYACDETSQMRINGEVTMAMAVKAGFSTEALSWKNTSQPECVTWTADQMLKLGIDLHSFVTTQTDNLEALTVYINSLTTVDAVNAVTWGMTIPTT